MAKLLARAYIRLSCAWSKSLACRRSGCENPRLLERKGSSPPPSRQVASPWGGGSGDRRV
jgi:hypothetical protein